MTSAQRSERTHFSLFVPGTPDDRVAWRKVLSGRGLTLGKTALRGEELPFEVEVEWVENPRDGSFAQAFGFGTATEKEQHAIDRAPGALVLSFPVDLHRARGEVISLVKTLAACGALAVRLEQSKLGFPVKRWLELISAEDPWSLYRATVVVLGGERSATTCGMHAFSLPDAHVELDDGLDAGAANHLLGVLNLYQVMEDPLLLSGHTFSPDAESPRREVRRWPDTTYEPGHACHNPFGVWRLGKAGKKPTPPGELAFVFMPALAVVLTAAEEQQGKPLTKAQVEKITQGAACMTMKHEDARALERSRGYADLDPELAWAQWKARAR